MRKFPVNWLHSGFNTGQCLILDTLAKSGGDKHFVTYGVLCDKGCVWPDVALLDFADLEATGFINYNMVASGYCLTAQGIDAAKKLQ